MQAIVFAQPGAPDVLRLADAPPAPLTPSGVRIKIHATAINRADLLQRQGKYTPPPGTSPILGLECAGDVVEVGPEVTTFKPGNRVMALLTGGGYATETVADAGSVMLIPAAWSYTDAAAFPETYLTAFFNIFMLGQADNTSTVLIHGGGSGIGTSAITLCRQAHIPRIIVTAGSASKCKRCVQHGAHHAINYRDTDFVSATREITDGALANVVLDCVGGTYLTRNLQVLAQDGRLVIIGFLGGAHADADLTQLLRKRLHIIGSTLRNQSHKTKATIVHTLQEQLKDAWQSGTLRPVIDQVYPWTRVKEAHERMHAGENFGKIVLQVS